MADCYYVWSGSADGMPPQVDSTVEYKVRFCTSVHLSSVNSGFSPYYI